MMMKWKSQIWHMQGVELLRGSIQDGMRRQRRLTAERRLDRNDPGVDGGARVVVSVRTTLVCFNGSRANMPKGQKGFLATCNY